MTTLIQINRPKRTIKSFVRRASKLPLSQQTLFDTLMPLYGISIPDKAEKSLRPFTELNTFFNGGCETILELGFGNGDSLAEMAGSAPEKDFIGVEVYQRGLFNLLRKIHQFGLKNIRVIQKDAVDVLSEVIQDQSLDGIQIYFPDPWPKQKHHKRRLIQSKFIELAARKLKPGGFIHLATDWEDYAHQMMSVMSLNTSFHNAAGSQQFAKGLRHRPITKYERRGHRLGHASWDLLFTKSKSEK